MAALPVELGRMILAHSSHYWNSTLPADRRLRKAERPGSELSPTAISCLTGSARAAAAPARVRSWSFHYGLGEELPTAPAHWHNAGPAVWPSPCSRGLPILLEPSD